MYEALSYLGEDLIKTQHFAEGHNDGSSDEGFAGNELQLGGP